MGYEKCVHGMVRETFTPESRIEFKEDAQVWYPTYERAAEHATVRADAWAIIFCWMIFTKREYSDRHPEHAPQSFSFARPISAAEVALYIFALTHTPPYEIAPKKGSTRGPSLAAPHHYWTDPNIATRSAYHADNLAVCMAESLGYLDGRPAEERRRFY